MSSFLVGEDTLVGGNDKVAELTGWQDTIGPFFEVRQSHIISGGDNSALVDSTNELNNNLLGSMIIDYFHFSDVPVGLHQFEELYHQFGDGSD